MDECEWKMNYMEMKIKNVIPSFELLSFVWINELLYSKTVV